MADFFENYLFNNYRAVFVHGFSDLGANINLLDILIRTGTEGFIERRPVLTRAGSMLDLGTDSSSELVAKLRGGLRGFENGEVDEELMSWKYRDNDIEETFSSARSFTGSLFAGPFAAAEAHFSRSRDLRLKSEGLASAWMNRDTLVDMVTDGSWKPNTSHGRLQWPDQEIGCLPGCLPSTESGRQLWVIYQILYATKLQISSAASASTGASLSCSIVPAAPGAGVTVSQESENLLTLKASANSKFPGKFMFAFKAVCFKFNAAGDLVNHETDVGKKQLVHRGEDDGPYDNERAQIRDLFVDPPEVFSDSEDEDDRELRALPIQESTG